MAIPTGTGGMKEALQPAGDRLAQMAAMMQGAQNAPGGILTDLLMDRWNELQSKATDRYSALEELKEKHGLPAALLDLLSPLTGMEVTTPEREKRQRALE